MLRKTLLSSAMLLESDSHGVFVREALIRDSDTQLTVADCYAAMWISAPSVDGSRSRKTSV
jgi:hypothetical protein